MNVSMRMTILAIFVAAAAVAADAPTAVAGISASSHSYGSRYRSHSGRYYGDTSTARYGDSRYRSAGFYFRSRSRGGCDSRSRSWGFDRYGSYSRYRYPSSRSYGAVRSVTIKPEVRAPVAVLQPVPDVPMPVRVTESAPRWARSDAWTLLTDGDNRVAAARFAMAALDSPGDANARVGYALAKAASGDLEQGAWALRRAFFEHRDVPSFPAGHPALTDLARSLVLRYDAALPVSSKARFDFEFAPAALAYLAGDASGASAAADALELDPRAEGAVANLRRLAREAVAGSETPGD